MNNKKDQSQEIFALSSELLPIVDVGMYETFLSPSRFEEWHNDYLQADGDPQRVEVDYDKFTTILCEEANTYVEEEYLEILKKYGVTSYIAGEIHSPREYNFETDQLYFHLCMKPDWYDTMRKKMVELKTDEKCKKYIDQHWRSRDGFISFMPQTFEEIELMQDPVRDLAAYLTLCLVHDNMLIPIDAYDRSDIILADRMEERIEEYVDYIPAEAYTI